MAKTKKSTKTKTQEMKAPVMEPVAPTMITNDMEFDNPPHMVTRYRDIRKAWAVVGMLIGSGQMNPPNFRDNAWSDNLDAAVSLIADTLAQLDGI